jgi:hypothetical protein
MNPTFHAVIAAAANKKRQEEEEKMVSYNKEDLDGWEFKIVRSNFGRFSNYEKVQKVCREEAKAGWELVEKFDEYRLRFKRRIDKRANDQFLTVDPYRTSIGFGDWSVGLLAALIGGVVIAGVLVFLLIQRGSDGPDKTVVALPFAAMAIIILALIVIRLRSRRK